MKSQPIPSRHRSFWPAAYCAHNCSYRRRRAPSAGPRRSNPCDRCHVQKRVRNLGRIRRNTNPLRAPRDRRAGANALIADRPLQHRRARTDGSGGLGCGADQPQPYTRFSLCRSSARVPRRCGGRRDLRVRSGDAASAAFSQRILSTLVFNFITVLFLQYLLTGPMKGYRVNLAESDPFPANALLPTLVQGSRAHMGILLVFVAFAAIRMLDRSPMGYRLRLLGASRSLALQAGIYEPQIIIATLCLSGAAAGIAGWMQAAGVDHRLYASIADPVGYTGLFAALMGGLTSLGVIVSSFFFAALLRGGDSLQIGAEVSPEITGVLVGLMMLVMAMLEMRIRRAEVAL